MKRIYSFMEFQLLIFILWSDGKDDIPDYRVFSIPEAAINLALNKGFVDNSVILSSKDEEILEKLFE